jgi:hypothetical protein
MIPEKQMPRQVGAFALNRGVLRFSHSLLRALFLDGFSAIRKTAGGIQKIQIQIRIRIKS